MDDFVPERGLKIFGDCIRALASSLQPRPRSAWARCVTACFWICAICLYQTLVGWGPATGWVAAQVGSLALCQVLAVRVLRGEPASGLAAAMLAAAYASHAFLYAALAAFLWLSPGRYGPAIACLVLAAGINWSLLKTRGAWVSVLGVVPIGAFFLIAPLWASLSEAAPIPTIAYWLTALILVVSPIRWGAELARMDSVAGDALAEAERRRLEAESATAAKSAFVAMISHELRTPINGLMGAARDLQAVDNPLVQDRAAITMDAAQLMRTLLNDLLDLAKIEAGRMTVECIPFDLGQVLEQTARLYAGDAQAKGVSLTLEWDDGMPAQVAGDPTRIRQILNNLLSNAVKFTDGASR